MPRVLNRAYAALNRVLDLAGSQIVADVNLDQAFAVHDLTNVVQAARAYMTVWRRTLTPGGAGTEIASLDFYDSTEWTNIYRVDGSGVQYDGPAPDLGWDVLLTHMGIYETTGDLNWAEFLTLYDFATNARIPVTSRLDVKAAPGFAYGPTSGEPYYLRPMPWLTAGQGRGEFFQVAYNTTVGSAFQVTVQGFVAPPGVLGRPW